MKRKAIRLAVLSGFIGGVCASESRLEQSGSGVRSHFFQMIEETRGNIAAHPLTRDELLLELNDDMARVFESLPPDGQKLALELASRGCNGNNQCKGLNACRTEKNACAGLGACKGQTKCAFGDKNHAVRVAAQFMEKKREGLLNAPGATAQ